MDATPERRRANDPRLEAIERQLEAGARRMQAIEDQQAVMAREMARNTEITTQIRDLLVVGRFGRGVIVWVAKIAAAGAAVLAIWQAIVSGGKPPTH